MKVAGCVFDVKFIQQYLTAKKYFIFLLTRPQGYALTLHSLANESYDYE